MRQLVPSFTAPSYMDKTLNQVQSCVNFYPEKTTDGYVLVSRPGFTKVGQISPGSVIGRQYVASTGQYFVLDASGIWEISNTGTPTSRGSFSSSTVAASMVDNGVTLLISTGLTTSYTLNLASGSAVAIVDVNFPVLSGGVTYLDGYFVAAEYGSGRFWVSALNDASDWTPAMFATAESYGDKLSVAFASNGQLYLFGERSIEIWYRTDNDLFPFQRISGAFIPLGIYGYNVAESNGSLYFATEMDSGGNFAIWKLTGSSVERISTPYIEALINNSFTQSSPILSVYAWQGHEFVQVNTSSIGESTLEYDASIGAWHETKSLSSGIQSRSRIYGLDSVRGVLGYVTFSVDKDDGSVYQIGFDSNSDNGDPITRVRTFGPIESSGSRAFHRGICFELEAQHDASSTYTLSATLEWSDNAGASWSSPITMTQAVTSGTTSQLITLEARRLGSSRRQRYYRLTFAGPAAKLVLKKCWLDAKEGRF